MTESLFRFLLLRQPVAEDPSRPVIKLAQSSSFQNDLKEALSATVPRDALIAASEKYIRSDKFIATTDGSDFQKKVLRISAIVDKLEAAGAVSTKTVSKAVKDITGDDTSVFVASVDFQTLSRQLADSIIAIKYVEKEHSRPLADLVDQLRDLDLIAKVAEQLQADQHSQSPSPRSLTGEGAVIVDGTESPAANIPAWQAQKNYAVDDKVKYDHVIYKCWQAHTSQSGWQPPLTPALWKLVEVLPPPIEPPPKLDTPLFRKRVLLLPFEIDLKPVISSSEQDQKTQDSERKAKMAADEKRAAELISNHAKLKKAIVELNDLSPELLETTAGEKSDGSDVDPDLSVKRLVSDQLAFTSALRNVALERAKLAPGPGPSVALRDESGAADPPVGGPSTLAEPIGAFGLAKDLLGKSSVLQPVAAFSPPSLQERTPRLQDRALDHLSDETKTVLSDRQINISQISVSGAVGLLERNIDATLRDLRSLVPTDENLSYMKVGSALIAQRTPILSKATALLNGFKIPRDIFTLPALPIDGRVPHTKGKVSPSGVADLLVVKQTLKAYQAADIAHVENVLKGEKKQRKHTVTTRTETLFNSEDESNKSEEHELASTTRFEMSKESAATIKEDQQLKGDLKVSAKYGPAVSVDASVSGSISRNKEEVVKATSKYAQDVTDRTVRRITERALQKQSTTTINEVVEVNEHGLNNESGTGHVSGVYQFLNKVYEAQVFNYGTRMMFDFMVPEPASFMSYALTEAAHGAEATLRIDKPHPFNLHPSDISESGVGWYVTHYGATDVTPPPESYITVSEQSEFGPGDVSTNYKHGGLLSIPDGYEAIYATVSAIRTIWEKRANSIDVMIGSECRRIHDGQWIWGTSVLNADGRAPIATGGTLPWSYVTLNCENGVVAVEVLCRVTQRRKRQWQAETHAKLLTAYKARLAEYEEKLSRQKLQDGIQIQGTNPTANLNTIKLELKKNAISILTAQHYEKFNSISTATDYPGGYPEINLFEAEAEGAYVRFFEQAFEWDQIMYITYPYFWGNKQNWIRKITVSDPDPVFDEFLKSGFARVVVPARPGFEGAIDHFMRFGEPWNGGTLPPVTSSTYVPIANELAERLGGPQGEIAQGEPWEVVLPTTLVKLRADDKLPTWKKIDGKWVPDA